MALPERLEKAARRIGYLKATRPPEVQKKMDDGSAHVVMALMKYKTDHDGTAFIKALRQHLGLSLQQAKTEKMRTDEAIQLEPALIEAIEADRDRVKEIFDEEVERIRKNMAAKSKDGDSSKSSERSTTEDDSEIDTMASSEEKSRLMAEQARDIKTIQEGSVHRGGTQITVPDGVSLKNAIKILENQIEYENSSVDINEEIFTSFWDGVYAFGLAMKEQFGWVHAKPTPSMFGEVKPQLISIPSGIGPTGELLSVLVAWGTFEVPGISGKLKTDIGMSPNGSVTFRLVASVKRRDERIIRELADRTRRIAKEQSLYKGHAVRMNFLDRDGDDNHMAQPAFMDVRDRSKDQLILPTDVKDQVETNVFTPIEYSDVTRQSGIPLKRGILLSGPYGTGKTLTADTTAMLCEKNGWTFVYVERVEELDRALKFAQQYQPAVVFCEDIDRRMSGQRSVDMDDVLNILDGIEGKKVEIMTILTTNHVEDINRAMLRPGRIDALIQFRAPDAAAATQLVQYYGRDLIEEGVDLHKVGEMLEGQIPAVIRETVERSKLAAIKIQKGNITRIGVLALEESARTLQHQQKLLASPLPGKTNHQVLGEALAEVVVEGLRKHADA